MVYAVLTVITCVTIAVVEARANRKLKSDFVRMDVKGWVMSASITAALLIAFCFGYAVQGTSLEWVSPYIDPAVLALVCLVIIPLPLSVVRQALSEIFLVTPGDLKLHVDEVAKAFVARHGLQSYRAYVAKVGRLREIELYFIVPKTMAAKTIDEWDTWRNEIGDAVGGEGPDRWLTVVFTGDPEWAEWLGALCALIATQGRSHKALCTPSLWERPRVAIGRKAAPGSRKRKSPRPFLVAGFDILRMVGRVGFEPTTNWLKANCSTN